MNTKHVLTTVSCFLSVSMFFPLTVHSDECTQYTNRLIQPQRTLFSFEEERARGKRVLERRYPDAFVGKGIHGKEILLLRSIEQRIRPFFPDYARGLTLEYGIVSDGTHLNARAVPGGIILIDSGIFTTGQDVGVVAGVLAHEIGHYINRHSSHIATLSLERESRIVRLLVQDMSLLERDTETAAAIVTERVGPPLDLAHVIREQELDADIFAARVVSSAGYNLSAHATYFETRAVAEGGGMDPNRTHPLDSVRAEVMRCYNTDTTKTFPTEEALFREIQLFYQSEQY